MADTPRFALIAPNYHPLTCGVGDNTMRLGAELLRRGHPAVVFTHAPALPHPEAPELPVRAIPDEGPLAVAAALAREITPGEFSHAVIEYTPRMWGASRFGSAALPLLAASLARQGIRVAAILHEVYAPLRARPDIAVTGLLLRLQCAALVRSCDPIYLTTDSRRRQLAPLITALSPPRTLATFRIGAGALPQPAAPVPGKLRVGLFSTLSVGKALDVVVDAFEKIAALHPEAELLLLGDLGRPGNPALTALETQIAATGVGSRVHLPGRLPLPDVARLVASLNLYLFPMDTGANTRSSTLPLALGAGVPVVAIKGPETDPLFEHGRNVWFADDLSGPAFARAALAVIGDQDLTTRLATGGQALYREHLAWERVGDSFLQTVG
jgi:glycosyltransferase involved in cell wall biosynthesis